MKQDTKQYPFFVYGTLLPTQPNAHLWQDSAITTEKAVFNNGRLYDMGHYPMLVAHQPGTVQGAVLHIHPTAYTTILTRFDTLEGFDPAQPEASAYRRVLQTVATTKAPSIQAWLYIGHPRYVVALHPIKEGDWLTYVQAQQKQLSQWWQDIDTVAGLHE